MTHWASICALVCLGGSSAGCVSLYVSDAYGEVRVTRQLGVLNVELKNPKQAITGTVFGVGLVAAPLGWSIGFTSQRWAVLGNGCRTVVFPDAVQLDQVSLDELNRIAAVCVLDDPSSTTKKAQMP